MKCGKINRVFVALGNIIINDVIKSRTELINIWYARIEDNLAIIKSVMLQLYDFLNQLLWRIFDKKFGENFFERIDND